MGCRWIEALLAIVIIVFAYPKLVDWNNEWVIIAAAALILLHVLFCSKCCSGTYDANIKSMPVKRAAPARKAKKRKRR